jgi:hypothetical protein
MAATLAALAWGFGWRAASVGAVFWGTQAASEFFWTGGAFLRQDWLFLLVLAAALLRKGRPFGAGAALTTAGLLRVFPLLLWIGPLAVVVHATLRHRRVEPAHRRLLAGGLAAVIALGGSSLVANGADAYPQFAHRMALRSEMPITNHMSLRTLFSAAPEARLESLADESLVDPMSPWIEARRKQLSARLPLYRLARAAFVGLLVITVWRLRSLWVALCLSLLAIPAMTDPSCYYYSVFLLAVPLSRVIRGAELALVALAGAGQLLRLRFVWFDDRFLALAALYVVAALALVGALARRPFSRRRSRVARPAEARFEGAPS